MTSAAFLVQIAISTTANGVIARIKHLPSQWVIQYQLRMIGIILTVGTLLRKREQETKF
jgi:hypothetical protein